MKLQQYLRVSLRYWRRLLATVERQFDNVLFDEPPLLPVTDAVVVASQTAGVIIGAGSGKVERPEFESAARLLDTGSITMPAVVLNNVLINGGWRHLHQLLIGVNVRDRHSVHQRQAFRGTEEVKCD